MMKEPLLTTIQKYRLGVAAQAAADAQLASFKALIEDADNSRASHCLELAEKAGSMNGAFYRLLHRQGLIVGDTVRVLTKGPYEGAVAEIHEFDYAHRAELRIGNVTVLVRSTEAELTDAAAGLGG